MKKIIVFLLLSIILLFTATAQNLTDKEWVKFYIEKLDSSRYVERNNLLTTHIRYTFSKNGTVEIWGYGQEKHEYELKDSVLLIAPYIRYKIEELSDSLLIMADISNQQLEKDKANRFYFTTEKKYLNNVLYKGLVDVLADSIVVSNRFLKPLYTYDLEKHLLNPLSSEFPQDIEFSGYFIISPHKKITNVTIKETDKPLGDFGKRFKELIQETNYRWKLPDNSKRYYYRVDFSMKISGKFTRLTFYKEEASFKFSQLTQEQKGKVNLLFHRGNKLLKRKKYEKAIVCFTKCLEIDKIFFDAYYNRAFAFKMVGRNKEACLDWKYLHDFGQTDGRNLYINNCK